MEVSDLPVAEIPEIVCEKTEFGGSDECVEVEGVGCVINAEPDLAAEEGIGEAD